MESDGSSPSGLRDGRDHPSAGRACRTGHESFTVDGEGTARRCHFIDAPIGNVYEADFDRGLRPSSCTNATCGCHIGYVHLAPLQLSRLFGDGILERIPRGDCLPEFGFINFQEPARKNLFIPAKSV